MCIDCHPMWRRRIRTCDSERARWMACMRTSGRIERMHIVREKKRRALIFIRCAVRRPTKIIWLAGNTASVTLFFEPHHGKGTGRGPVRMYRACDIELRYGRLNCDTGNPPRHVFRKLEHTDFFPQLIVKERNKSKRERVLIYFKSKRMNRVITKCALFTQTAESRSRILPIIRLGSCPEQIPDDIVETDGRGYMYAHQGHKDPQ